MAQSARTRSITRLGFADVTIDYAIYQQI